MRRLMIFLNTFAVVIDIAMAQLEATQGNVFMVLVFLALAFVCALAAIQHMNNR